MSNTSPSNRAAPLGGEKDLPCDSSFRSTLNVIAGVIKEGETNRMARLIYRVSRGSVATFFQNIGTVGEFSNELLSEDADKKSSSSVKTGQRQKTSYAAYVLVFTESDYLLDKVQRIALNFSSNSYTMQKGQTD